MDSDDSFVSEAPAVPDQASVEKNYRQATDLPHPKKDFVRDIGRNAKWTLSTCKPGFGVQQLLDGQCDTYWQSDGAQPHTASLMFTRKCKVAYVYFYMDHKQDESYTPSKMTILIGNSQLDLQVSFIRNIQNNCEELIVLNLDEPQGWICVDVGKYLEEQGEGDLKFSMLQVAIHANHQNGKDTHLRQIKVFSSTRDQDPDMPMQSLEFQMFSQIR